MCVTILSALEAAPAAAVAPRRPAPRAVEAQPDYVQPAPRVPERAPAEPDVEDEPAFDEPAAPRIAYVDSDEAVSMEPEPARVAASAVKATPLQKKAEVKQEQMLF